MARLRLHIYPNGGDRPVTTEGTRSGQTYPRGGELLDQHSLTIIASSV